MGIDRHELEHRNWRWSSAKPLERDDDIVQRDVPIVPDDVDAVAVKPRKPRTSVSKVKNNA